MANFNRKFKSLNSIKDSDAELNFWRETGVKIDSNREKGTTQLNLIIKERIGKCKLHAIKEIATLFGITFDKENKEQLIELICKLSNEQKLIILNLHDFSNRKKRTINEYFDHYGEEATTDYTDPLSRIYYLFRAKPSHLFSIRVLNIWQNHASGAIYSLDKKLKRSIAEKVANEITFEQNLRDKLYNASKQQNNYKIHSFCEINDKFIIQMYKRVNDVSKEDFDQAIRNQEVSRVTFSLDIASNLIEIKTKVGFEETAIKEYIEETFEGVLTKVEAGIFKDINQEIVMNSILKGISASGGKVDDFLVEKIKFRESPLENSPSITFSLENVDIWQSVNDAYVKGAISLNSIKSVETISFRSNDTKRTVFSSILENGNIIFQMDDSRLDKEKKEKLEQKFFERFGLPLYKQISNTGSTEGEADLVDYLIRRRSSLDLESNAKQKHEELIEAGLIKNEEIFKCVCVNKSCSYEEILENKSDKKEECPECEAKVSVNVENTIEVAYTTIRQNILDKLEQICSLSDWKYHGKATRKISSVSYEFMKMENPYDGKILKILVSTKTISTSTLTKLKKFLDPTLILVVGQSNKAVERYSTGCFFAIGFGNFYQRTSTDLIPFLEQAYNTLKMKTKDFIAEAATESFYTMKNNVGNPRENKYDPSDLEDDVYTVIKDLFLNVQKWGHENIGHELPEGIFTLYYEQKNGRNPVTNKLAFSYDCKLNLDLKGFNFSISEKDKAVRYIESLSNTMEISEFTNNNHLTGHIFISNKFKETNAKHTYNDIKKKIQHNYDTEIIFLTVDSLLYLHEQYRRNYALIEGSKDLFMVLINQAFMSLRGEFFNRLHVDKIITTTLRYAGKKVIDYGEITNQLTDELFSMAN
ncbi:hypothetical protein GLW20_04040 [Virgibacillus halodenitrificans]|nr:hypothetical protein [Virgibacillus halodenitrificans]